VLQHSNLMDAPGMTTGELTARLVTRWRTRLSVALHRALAEVYLQRAEKRAHKTCGAGGHRGRTVVAQ
jgi:hypothetical protein